MIIILSVSLLTLVKGLTLKQVLLAIDCGGQEAFSAKEGYLYQEDKYFSGDSRVSDYTYSDALYDGVRFTFTPKVYFTERHGTTFDYNIPINKNGQYTLILQFVELYFENENERQFDVFIGIRRILHNFSIIDEKHPKGSAREMFIYVEIKDDILYYNGEECKNGYNNGKLKLSFTKGAADLPKVDGIVIVKGHDAGEQEKMLLVENWEQMLLDNKKKQAELERAELESQNLIIPDEIDEDSGEGLLSFLFSPIGIFIILFGFGLFALVALTGESEQTKQEKKKKKK